MIPLWPRAGAARMNRKRAAANLVSMGRQILGIHHVTAIADDPQENLDFYTQVLGLHLVKLTVNFDDPGTYHFYFGDGEGRPGTLLTFFPWPGAPQGRRGTGQATTVALSIPEAALGFWAERMWAHGITVEGPERRFGEEAIVMRDRHGLELALVASADAREPWRGGPVPPEYAIRGLHGVTLAEEGLERTAALFETLGFRLLEERGSRLRYAAGEAGAGAFVDVEVAPDLRPGRVAVGSVHHVAWRTASDAEQQEWHGEIAALGYNVTPVIDRRYFRSIYFREPGGVLFEIATDGPGFTVDEPAARLGSALMLPPALEPRRKDLELHLPAVSIK